MNLLPRRLVSAVRLVDIFQRRHGHTRSQNGLIVDGTGKPQPWLTYPAIEFLRALDLSKCALFEFGAGSSTLFWAERCASVWSVELNREWYDKLAPLLPGNAQIIHEPDGHVYATRITDPGRRFEVIVIDGAERMRCAQSALSCLRTGGMILLDNAEWYPRTADLLASAGLIEVRFSGMTPLNAFASTTTVFLHREFSIPTGAAAREPPVGGRRPPEPALDD